MDILKRVLLFLLIIISVSCQGATQSPKVENGVLDLRQIQQGDEFTVTMNGEWQFFFKTFLYGTPGEISDSPEPDCYASVPGYWTDCTVNGHSMPRFGYATYRALILLPSGYRDHMGFDVPVFDTSYELAINGVTVARNGTPARNRAESIPAYKPFFFSYSPKKDTLEILIRVSNYEHRRGGFWMPLKTGTFNTIRKNYTNHWFISIAASGMLFASFLFFFVFYFLDRRDKKLLMFSILALCLTFRPFLSAPYLITVFNIKNWDLIVRGEYLILFLMITSGSWLAYLIYPHKWFRKFAVAISSISLAGVILVLFLHVYQFSYSVFIIEGTAILILIYVLTMSLIGIIHKKQIDIWYFIAFLAISAGLLADILVSNALEENLQLYVLSFLMLVFVMIQATLLIRDWINTGRERERLSYQFEELNRNLETRVEMRTKELRDKSEELNARNEQIAQQNRKLTETISLKNKIFSVIAHDLRSPIVNILYTLYMLKDEEFRDKTESLADSCIQYSQRLIGLLENMLVWGRGQEDMIRYAPAENDLADIILTNISILKDSADRKDISINFTQVGRSKGWFDKDLIDIVVRNLLANAIKYTNHGGKVTVIVRDKEESGEWVTIKICDDGIGISKERQATLFTGTEINTTPGTDSEKGTGIGLRLVYELVEISKGNITVESSPGKGSCFTVFLPGPDRTRRNREYEIT